MNQRMQSAAVKPPFLTLTVPIDPAYDVNRAIEDAITLAGGVTTLHFCSVVDAAATTASATTGAIIDAIPMIEGLEARAAASVHVTRRWPRRSHTVWQLTVRCCSAARPP